MQFRDIALTPVGVSGIVPAGWAQAGDGRFNRGAFAGDPTMLYEEAFPHVATITHCNHPPGVMTTHPAMGYNECIQPTQSVVMGLFSNLDTW